MNIPGFSAEASFYRTSGQCQIARQLINSSLHEKYFDLVNFNSGRDIPNLGGAP